jgi:hypothetical protein
MDFQLAAVAGARVDMANGERAAEMREDQPAQLLLEGAQRRVGLRRGLREMPVRAICFSN